jgi:putative endonuclease
MLTNVNNTVIYVGVTNDLTRRLSEHKSGAIDSFTKRYRVHKLVYFEEYHNPNDAISREKQLKGWRRSKKNALVETTNPSWSDLSR